MYANLVKNNELPIFKNWNKSQEKKNYISCLPLKTWRGSDNTGSTLLPGTMAAEEQGGSTSGLQLSRVPAIPAVKSAQHISFIYVRSSQQEVCTLLA